MSYTNQDSAAAAITFAAVSAQATARQVAFTVAQTNSEANALVTVVQGINTNTNYLNATLESLSTTVSNIPTVTVEDSLTSTSALNALSANQGKVLKDAADALATTVSTLSGNSVFTEPTELTSGSNIVDFSGTATNYIYNSSDALNIELDSWNTGAAKITIENKLGAALTFTNNDNTTLLTNIFYVLGNGKYQYSNSSHPILGKFTLHYDVLFNQILITGINEDPRISSLIVNNLTSTSTTNALSAAQGKALNDRLVTVEASSGSSVTVVDDLTSSTTDALSANQGLVLSNRVTFLEDTVITGYTTLGTGDSIDFSGTGTKFKYEGVSAINVKVINASSDFAITFNNLFASTITLKQSDGTTDQPIYIDYNGSVVAYGTSTISDSFILEYRSSISKFVIK